MGNSVGTVCVGPGWASAWALGSVRLPWDTRFCPLGTLPHFHREPRLMTCPRAAPRGARSCYVTTVPVLWVQGSCFRLFLGGRAGVSPLGGRRP